MFSIFKPKNKPPRVSADNPGIGHTLKVAFSNSERGTWEEKVNLVVALSKALSENGHEHKTFDSWIELPNSLILQPQIVSLEPLEDGGVKTATTIELSSREDSCWSLFEYQHSTGDDSKTSVIEGYHGWVKSDLVAILEAFTTDLKECTSLVMNFPERENDRVVVLGPVSHCVAEESNVEEEHPFCPCCLFTNNFESFQSLIDDEGVYGIRLFVMRDEDGTIAADCRVNGLEYLVGRNSLIEYGATWPNSGFEFRKQYVVMKSAASGNDSSVGLNKSLKSDAKTRAL